MKFDHKVKFNGKWYMPFEEIPEEEKKQKTSYDRKDIIRMSIADLKKLAKKHDIDNSENMTAAKLKEAMIEKLGL